MSARSSTVERVFVLANFEKPAVRELAAELLPWLEKRVPEVRFERDIRSFAQGFDTQEGAPLPQLVVVLGGDGALLGAVRAFADSPVPTLGINLGRVGFLASTPASRWEETLAGVLEGRGVLERRLRLEAEWSAPDRGRSGRAVALNDVVLQRGSHQGMLSAALSVGETFVTNYRADGVIVATPSGSTAYSLSAGGPILEPGVDALVVTPLCSQGLSSRPIVLHAREELSLRVLRSSGITTLAIDGQTYHGLREGELLRLRKHPVPYPVYAMAGLDPYRRLRSRLGWGGGVESAESIRTEPAPSAHDLGEGGLL